MPGELNLTRVAAGTTEDAFRPAIAGVVGGGPFPEMIEATVGITGEEGVTARVLELPAGEYFAWSVPEEPEGESPDPEEEPSPSPAETDEEEDEEEGPPPEAFLIEVVTVTEGEEGELPETGGTVTAEDYAFDIDLEAGDRFVFRNTGPDQFHHAVIFDFGTTDAQVVEENLPAFLESGEDEPPPAAFEDVDMESLEAGASGVFSPGLGGTFEAEIESGNTYAFVCFIQDRSGGPPHVFAHDMYDVFTVS